LGVAGWAEDAVTRRPTNQVDFLSPVFATRSKDDEVRFREVERVAVAAAESAASAGDGSTTYITTDTGTTVVIPGTGVAGSVPYSSFWMRGHAVGTSLRALLSGAGESLLGHYDLTGLQFFPDSNPTTSYPTGLNTGVPAGSALDPSFSGSGGGPVLWPDFDIPLASPLLHITPHVGFENSFVDGRYSPIFSPGYSVSHGVAWGIWSRGRASQVVVVDSSGGWTLVGTRDGTYYGGWPTSDDDSSSVIPLGDDATTGEMYILETSYNETGTSFCGETDPSGSFGSFRSVSVFDFDSLYSAFVSSGGTVQTVPNFCTGLYSDTVFDGVSTNSWGYSATMWAGSATGRSLMYAVITTSTLVRILPVSLATGAISVSSSLPNAYPNGVDLDIEGNHQRIQQVGSVDWGDSTDRFVCEMKNTTASPYQHAVVEFGTWGYQNITPFADPAVGNFAVAKPVPSSAADPIFTGGKPSEVAFRAWDDTASDYRVFTYTPA
jgi:hypothetical protein